MTDEQPHPAHPDERESFSVWDDPVVAEVRAIRRRLWEAAGRDIHRFIEQTRKAEERRAAENRTDTDAR